MTIRAKENLLHRIIATSAFVFALCILPVAQYLLIGRNTSAANQSGSVAGVSTDTTITEQSIPTASPVLDPNSCAAQQQEIAKLQSQIDAWKTSFSSWETTTNQQYDQRIIDLAGTVSSDELASKAAEIKAQKNQLVGDYAASVDGAVASLSSQKKEAASRSCIAG